MVARHRRVGSAVAGTASTFRVGDWTVEPSRNRVTRGDEATQLEAKVMDVLVCLAERAGEVLPRDVIVDTVWATEFIAANTLTHAIAVIRRALGDDPRSPEFIETIPKRGYRLIAPVRFDPPVGPRPGPTIPRFKLLVEGRARLLHDGDHVIGRVVEADIQVDVPGVSRRHARLTIRGDEAVVDDLGSKNGTFVGEQRVVGPTGVESGAEIRLGRQSARLRLVLLEDETLSEGSVT